MVATTIMFPNLEFFSNLNIHEHVSVLAEYLTECGVVCRRAVALVAENGLFLSLLVRFHQG